MFALQVSSSWRPSLGGGRAEQGRAKVDGRRWVCGCGSMRFSIRIIDQRENSATAYKLFSADAPLARSGPRMTAMTDSKRCSVRNRGGGLGADRMGAASVGLP